MQWGQSNASRYSLTISKAEETSDMSDGLGGPTLLPCSCACCQDPYDKENKCESNLHLIYAQQS